VPIERRPPQSLRSLATFPRDQNAFPMTEAWVGSSGVAGVKSGIKPVWSLTTVVWDDGRFFAAWKTLA
jgi:hypothetical protein